MSIRKDRRILLYSLLVLSLITAVTVNSIEAASVKPNFDKNSSTGVYCNKLWDQIQDHKKNGEDQQAKEKTTHYEEVCAPIYGGSPRLSQEIGTVGGNDGGRPLSALPSDLGDTPTNPKTAINPMVPKSGINPTAPNTAIQKFQNNMLGQMLIRQLVCADGSQPDAAGKCRDGSQPRPVTGGGATMLPSGPNPTTPGTGGDATPGTSGTVTVTPGLGGSGRTDLRATGPLTGSLGGSPQLPMLVKVTVKFTSIDILNKHEGAFSSDGEFKLFTKVTSKGKFSPNCPGGGSNYCNFYEYCSGTYCKLREASVADGLWDVSNYERVPFQDDFEIIYTFDKGTLECSGGTCFMVIKSLTRGFEDDGKETLSPVNFLGATITGNDDDKLQDLNFDIFLPFPKEYGTEQKLFARKNGDYQLNWLVQIQATAPNK